MKGDVMCAVIAITVHDDAHLAFVQAHLKDDIIVLDPRAMLRGEDLSYLVTAHGAHVSFRGEVLDRVTGVWYRKPGEIDIDTMPVPENFKEYALDAQQKHFALLRDAFPGAAWISDYYAIGRMRNKFHQLQLARECGFLVPDTLTRRSMMSAPSSTPR
jgi:hypothetical protein